MAVVAGDASVDPKRFADLEKTVGELGRRVDDLADDVSDVAGLPEKVAELKGLIEGLRDIATRGFGQVQRGQESLVTAKTLVTFAATVLVPVLVALIGGYFALKAGSGH